MAFGMSGIVVFFGRDHAPDDVPRHVQSHPRPSSRDGGVVDEETSLRESLVLPDSSFLPGTYQHAASVGLSKQEIVSTKNPAPAPPSQPPTQLPRGLTFSDPKKPPQLPDSAECGTVPNLLVVGILGSPSERSKVAREAIRQTWAKLPTEGSTVVIRFLLALDGTGEVPEAVSDEAKAKGDLVILETHDKYENLGEKVRLFFKWTVDFCLVDPSKPTYILKTDDDSFVRIDELVKELKRPEIPTSSLLYGRMMTKMPGGKNKRGKWDPDNRHFLQTWPTYPSGAAYIVTIDVARVFGYPALPLEHHKNEDRRVGVVLFGYNISYINAPRFYPWGHCADDAIMIHYNRRPELLQRRYQRILKGESVCGSQFPSNQQCLRSKDRGNARFECPKGTTIQTILNASYSRQLPDQDHARYPWCQEGFEGIEIDPDCSVDAIKIVEEKCVGKAECEFVISGNLFGGDPCPRMQKHFQGVVECQ
jgi:hypothetical protein